MTKKRVLFFGESHHLASGFGTYAKQVLERLAKTDKYELAEFACYGDPSAVGDLPWHYYGNLPQNDQQRSVYDSSPVHSFGMWRFGNAVLHFKPDIVITYRDPWMDNWIETSPLRKFFHWAWMPTVDSAPQKREWLETFATCDAVFTYSEYGERTLKAQCGDSINIIGCASPGIDPKLYAPVEDKRKHKASFDIPEDSFVVGTVMRNQRRKLFVELMKAFKIFLDKAPKELAKKSYLYLHTSYPESAGWDIGRHILQQGIASKVLCTYICQNCGKWFVSKFKEAGTRCHFCGSNSANMPNVSHGLSIPELIKVYNLFDLYAQYAICEGFGMPQVEAASCGVPIASSNYSAMEDILEYTKGYPIKIDKLFRELETDAERVYPCNEHMSEIMLEYATISAEDRAQKVADARNGAVTRYDWDDTAAVWEKYIDSYTAVELQGKWDHPPQMRPSLNMPPPTVSDQDFINWCFEMCGREYKTNGLEVYEHVASLRMGVNPKAGNAKFDRNIFLTSMNNYINECNNLEMMRVGNAPAPGVDSFFKEKANV